MKAMKLLVGAALTAAAFGVSATTYDLYTLDGLKTQYAPVAPGAISDTFIFDIASSSPVASSSAVLNLSLGSLSLLNITGFKVELFNPSDSSLGTASFDGLNFVLNTGPLSVGNDYYFKVTGMATGTAGGSYSFALAPVPEPETWAMLLAGMGIMGVVARRRRAAA